MVFCTVEEYNVIIVIAQYFHMGEKSGGETKKSVHIWIEGGYGFGNKLFLNLVGFDLLAQMSYNCNQCIKLNLKHLVGLI